MRLARTTATFAALAVIATASACTSDSSPGQPASTTPSTSDAAGALATALRGGVRSLTSAHFAITGTLGSSPITGDGVQRVQNGRLTGLQATANLPVAGTVAIVVDGADRYVKLPAALATRGKPWTKVTAGSGNVIVQQLDGLLDGALSAADLSGLNQLAGAAKSVRKVGTEQVSGTPATRYDLVVDPAKLPDSLTSRAGLGTADIPVKLWLDDRGRPVQVQAAVPVAGQPVKITVTFDRFGEPVTITAPPASQVATG